MRETVMAEDIVNSLGMIREELEQTRKDLQKEESNRTKTREAFDKAKLGGDKVLQKSLNTDLMRVGKSLSNLTKKNDNLLTNLSETQTSSLEELTSKFAAQNDSARFDLSTTELGNQIKLLNKDSNDNSMQLKELFEQSVTALDNPDISDQERELAMDQIEALKGMASSEEDTREAKRLQEEANSRLLQMANGLDGMASGFDKFSDNFKKGAGLIGALGAIGLMLFSPETLYKIIDSVINFFDGMYKTIRSIIDGDWETAKVLIGENIKGIGIAVAGFFAIFGGTIMRGIGSVLKMARTFGNIVGKIGKVFGKIFIPFTIAMGAFAAITGFIEGFKEGGILEGLKQGVISLFDMLVAAPLDLLKDGVSWVLGKMGFENASEALESFSFSELFTSMFDSIFGIVGSAVDWVKGVFSNFDIAGTMQALWEGLVGEGGLFDILFAPVDMAINWIMGMFAFETPEESFSLREMIGGVVDNVINFFSELFNFLPSLDEISAKLKSILPSWLGGEEPGFNVATANDEQLRAQAKDNAGFFGDEDKEYNKLVEQKKDAIQTQLDTPSSEYAGSQTTLNTRPVEEKTRSMIRGSDEAQSNNLIQGSESTPLAPRIEPATTPGAVLSSTNTMMDNKAQAAAQTNMTIIQASSGGGGSRSGGNVSSATAITNNISQGFSADDGVRIDFVNPF